MDAVLGSGVVEIWRIFKKGVSARGAEGSAIIHAYGDAGFVFIPALELAICSINEKRRELSEEDVQAKASEDSKRNAVPLRLPTCSIKDERGYAAQDGNGGNRGGRI